MKVLNNLDLNKNEIQNARVQNLASAPSTPVEGQIYYDTTLDEFRVYNGTGWVSHIPTSEKGAASGVASLDASSKVVQDPANATVTPTINKIPIADVTGGKLAAGWIPDLSGTYATAAKGVTNGDSHDHNGGDGAQIDHVNLANKGTNTHAQIDTFVASKAAASGLASLNASSKVVQDPANAQTTAAASKIPLGDGSGKIANAWLNTGTGNGIDADKVDNYEASALLSRANHSGTQLAATISDFATEVVKSRLDQMAAPTSSVAMNSQKITGLGAPTLDGDAATKLYVDTAVQGLDIKSSVKAATTANITLSGTQTIDGVALVADERVLVKDQTTASQNGVYLVKASAWARATDADAWAELPGAFVFVEQGTVNADTGWVCTSDAGGTLGSTSVAFTQFSQAGVVTASNVGSDGVGVFKQKSGIDLQFRNVAPGSTKITTTLNGSDIDIDVVQSNLDKNSLGGSALSVANGGTGGTTAATARANLSATGKVTQAIGNGSLTTIDVTHSLGTRDVIASVRRTGTPYDVVMCDIEQLDTNTTRFVFAVAPTSNEYTAIIIG